MDLRPWEIEFVRACREPHVRIFFGMVLVIIAIAFFTTQPQ